jgi:hypothetical protein
MESIKQDITRQKLLQSAYCEMHQRIRLDCDREASHNLNRLLDKPGMAAAVVD